MPTHARQPLAGLRTATLVVAGLVLVGWTLGSELLVAWGGPATASVVTALAGGAVVVVATGRRPLRRWATAGGFGAVLLVGGLAPTLVEASVHVLLPGASAVPSLGALLSLALLLVAAALPDDLQGAPDVLLALGAVAVTSLSVVGLLLGDEALVAAGAATVRGGLSLPTVALVVLGAAVVWLRRPQRLVAVGRLPLLGVALTPLLAVVAALAGRDLYLALVALLALAALAATLRQLAVSRGVTNALTGAMLDSSPAPTLLVAADGVIQRANGSAAELFGWPVEELVGGNVDRLVPADRRPTHAGHRRGFVAAHAADGPVASRMMQTTGVEAVRADGSRFHADVWLASVDVGGTPMVVATVRDVSDVVDHIAALEDLQAMQALLMTTVTHDLRSPLTVIRGMADLLARDGGTLDEEVRADLSRRIAENARKLDELITDLLDLERLRRGGLVAVSTVGLEVAAEHAVEAATQLGIEAVVAPVTGLPPVVAEPAMLRRIVDNFLGNAGKYAPGPVEVDFVPEDGGVWLLVEDHGRGVPVEHREKVFEVFERGMATDGEVRGTGVGLSLVREFARRIGGRALVGDRRDGRPGASFRVWFPSVPQPVAELRRTG